MQKHCKTFLPRKTRHSSDPSW